MFCVRRQRQYVIHWKAVAGGNKIELPSNTSGDGKGEGRNLSKFHV